MPWKPNNAGQQMAQQAQQAQQRVHRHNQQFARKQMQGLQDQWRARQVHIAAQMQARQQQQDALPQKGNAPRPRGGWSSGPPESLGGEVPSLAPSLRSSSDTGGRSGVFVGEARNIDLTEEQGGMNYQRTFRVLTFRVDCRDSTGNLQQSVPVRLRGQRIVGNVKEGERVEVRGRRGRDGVVQVGSFRNLVTNSNVTGGGLFNFTVPSLGWGRGGSTSAAGAARAGRVAVLIGAIVFTASVTMLTDYVNNGTGGKSLLQATSGDLASPLYPKDFRILIGLAALVFVATILSGGMFRRPFMIVAAVASVGLIGYTLHVPQIGLAPGFGTYGSSYWLSLLAAVVMTLGAVVAAAARSDH